MEHLTDRQLQAYVDGEPVDDAEAIEKHVRSCRQCLKQVNAYRFVRSGLVQEPPEASFSDDFDDAVMSRILHSDTSGFQVRDYLVAAFAGVMVIALLWYPFLYYNELRMVIMDSFTEGIGLLKELSVELFCNGTVGSGCMAVPAAALIMILAFTILDKTYVKPRLRTTRGNL